MFFVELITCLPLHRMSFLLAAVFLFSLNNVLWKKNLTNSSTEFLVCYRAVFTSLFSWSALFLFLPSFSVSLSDYLKITLGSVLGTIGLFSMLFFLKKSSLQWVGIYNLIGIAITTLYVWIFEKVELSSVLFGGAFIFVGFGWFLKINSTNSFRLTMHQHALLFLMTVAFSSASLIHWKNLTEEVSPLVIISNQESIVFVISLLLLIKKNKFDRIRHDLLSNFRSIAFMSFILLAAFTCSLMGLKVTNPVVSGMIFLASPLTTILFSSYFFKEKITWQHWLAISLLSMGAFLLHVQAN